MEVKQSDTENLEYLVEKARKQKKNIQKHLLEYFESISKKEKFPIMGLDSQNKVIFANSRVRRLVGTKVFENLIGKRIYDFMSKEDVKTYKALVEQAHLSAYNSVHLELRRKLRNIDITAELKRDQEGNYLCSVVRLRKESLPEQIISLLHKSKMGISKKYPGFNITEVETVYTKEIVNIHLETIENRVTDNMAKNYIKTLLSHLDNQKNKKPIDVVIDLTRTPNITRKAAYIFAAFAYGMQRCFPEKAEVHLHADKKLKERYNRYLEDMAHKPRGNPWEEKFDDFKIRHLHNALEFAEKRVRMTDETIKQDILREYRGAFRKMLKSAGLYQQRRQGLSDSFISGMFLSPDNFYPFSKIVRRFHHWSEKKRFARIGEIYKPVFEKYLKEVCVMPELPPQLKAKKLEAKKPKEKV